MKESYPIDCWIRPDSIREAQVVPGAKIWIKWPSLPPSTRWTHLVVFESHGPSTTDGDGSVIGTVALDRTVPHNTIRTTRPAAFDKVRAALVHRPRLSGGSTPKEDDSTLLGDGNGRSPTPLPPGEPPPP